MRPCLAVQTLQALLSFPYFLGWVLQRLFGICGYQQSNILQIFILSLSYSILSYNLINQSFQIFFIVNSITKGIFNSYHILSQSKTNLTLNYSNNQFLRSLLYTTTNNHQSLVQFKRKLCHETLFFLKIFISTQLIYITKIIILRLNDCILLTFKFKQLIKSCAIMSEHNNFSKITPANYLQSFHQPHTLILEQSIFKKLSASEIILIILNDIETYSTLQSVTQPQKMSSSRVGSSRSTTKQSSSGCTCKKTRCLKLYCECFASGGFCKETCNCQKCGNNTLFHLQRSEAIFSALQRYPQAFSIQQRQTKKQQHKGCTCKKSYCQKKYCQCYAKGRRCVQSCKCLGCKNSSKSLDHSQKQDLQLQKQQIV